jgi:diguanylate cyclase (GGDEF)-like protein
MNRQQSQATGATNMVRKLVVLLAIVVIAEVIVMIGSIVVGTGPSGADLAASIVRILLVALSGAFLLGRDTDEASAEVSTASEAPQQSDGIVTVWPNIDELTHTSNQRGLTIHMLEMMALAERYHHKLSVCLIKVSGLNALGQEDREETLIGISTVLAELVRIPDKVGRYDEETFMVIMPEADYAGASLVAGRLQNNLDKAISDRTPIAMGVAEFERGDDLQRLLDRAQQALNKA